MTLQYAEVNIPRGGRKAEREAMAEAVVAGSSTT